MTDHQQDTFQDIEVIQQRNQMLLLALRELSDKEEASEKNAVDSKTAHIQQALETALAVIEHCQDTRRWHEELVSYKCHTSVIQVSYKCHTAARHILYSSTGMALTSFRVVKGKYTIISVAQSIIGWLKWASHSIQVQTRNVDFHSSIGQAWGSAIADLKLEIQRSQYRDRTNLAVSYYLSLA